MRMWPLLGCGPLFYAPIPWNFSQLTNQDGRPVGIKAALNTGAAAAIGKLGVPGGFLNNPKVKIPLPPALDEIAKGMRFFGTGEKIADELGRRNESGGGTSGAASEGIVDQRRQVHVH